MIKVECVSCKAPYELDERRIPEKGMKMRCPKCGTSFGVTRTGIANESAAVSPPPAAPAPAAPPPAAPVGVPKMTMLGHNAPIAPPPGAGIAPPKPAAIPIAPPAPAAIAAPPPAAPAAAARPPMGTMMGIAPPVLDPNKLPAGMFGGAKPAGAPNAPPTAAKGAFGAAPAAPAPAAPKAAAPLAPDFPTDIADLPAPRGAMPSQKRPEGAPKLPSIELSDLSVSNIRVDQLPMPKREVDLPRPNASMTPPASVAAQIDADSDLPAVKPAGAPAPFTDLPAVKPAAPKPAMQTKIAAAPMAAPPMNSPKGFADLPAVKQQADLPAVKTEVDLPAPKGPALAFGDLDLPAPKMSADLPAVKQRADLPAVKQQADLPAVKTSADLPQLKGHADLPTPQRGGVRFGEIDLPTPKAGAVDLPTPKGLVDLPAPNNDLPAPRGDDSSFADVALDLPDFGTEQPTTPDDGFGDIELPPPKPAADMVMSRERTMQGQARRAPTAMQKAMAAPAQPNDGPDSEMPPSLMTGDESSFDDLNLDDGLNLSMPPTPQGAGRAPARPAPQNSLPPSLAGDPDLDEEPQDDLLDDDLVDEGEEYEEGDDFGEEEFSGDEEGDQEMGEFGISGDDAGRASLAPDALRRQRGEDFEARQAALRKRTVTIVVRLAAVLVILTAASAALAFTEYGIFGIYYWEKYLPEAGDAEFARSAIEKAEKIAATDTYTDVMRSLKELGGARSKAGINRTLLSRGLVHESLFVVRFGDNPGASARAVAILKRLEERSGRAPEMDLARAADAARRKAWPDATRLLGAARAQGPRDPYVELLAGEVAFAQGKLDDAEKAFAQALKLGGAARAQWGLARVALGRQEKPDKDAQAAAVNETLKLSPMHIDARIAEAQIVWSQGKEERGVHLLQVALGREPTEEDRYLWSSTNSRAAGYSVLGYIHETRGRSLLAREAYEQALKADAYKVEALLGSGRVLLHEGRANDALPRFEAALNSATKGGGNPIVLSGRRADMEAQLGIARVLLAIDRAPEAKAKLLELETAMPEDAEVALALGETEEKLGNTDRAEEEIRKSIKLAPTKFDGYLSLSQLFSRQNDAAKASEILNEAAAHVEETAHMRRMLGQSELARGKTESAIHELKRALELDPYDLEAQFGLGIALRQSGDLEGAEKALEAIAKRDPNFAGLAEQRGLLLEARGQYDGAVSVYQGALEKDPTDMALLLRLGAAQVLANKLDDAEQTLAKVLREKPNSAEAEYFVGRIAFARGRTPDALAHFDRAIGLDITKGEYHLYVARATYDMGNYGRTLEEVEIALKRDPLLGDAFWVRSMVRLRMGAVQDALKDVDKALKLNPMRTDAYVVRGKCYEQLRQLSDAVAAYRTALERDPTQGEWWYRLGGLQFDSGSPADAEAALRHALEIGEKTDPMPWWLPDAYRMSGEIAERANNRQVAIRHYKRYTEIANQSNAIDYGPVLKKLKEWGVELSEDE